MTRHGQYRSRLYRVWANMRQRCNPSSAKVAERPSYATVRHDPSWATFQGFIDNPPAGVYDDTKVLSRLGDTGDYTPTNCRWVTKSENATEAAALAHRDRHGRFTRSARRLPSPGRNRSRRPSTAQQRLAGL